MTRSLLQAAALALVLAGVGCADAADDAPVATVGDWTLTRERVADLLVLAQPLPLDSATAASLVDHWVAVAALARAAAGGVDLQGAEAREASLWLERRQALLDTDPAAPDRPVPPAEARASFEADTLLLLAHTLKATSAATSAAELELQRGTARAILDDLLAGGGWEAAVARSDDAATRDASGLLGLVRAEELPAGLQGAARALQPGQVSDVVRSDQGFHVLYRPRWGDVAPLYARLLADRRREEAERRRGAAVADSLGVTVDPGAPDRIRRWAAANPLAAVADGAALARWEGGSLDAEVAVRYLAALPDPARAEVAAAPDSAVVRFVGELAAREARIQRARVQGDDPGSAPLDSLHAEEMRRWASALGAEGGGGSPAAVDRYMERLVARQVELRPVPPLLARWLLQEVSWSVDQEALKDAVERARRMVSGAEGAP